MPAIGRKMIPKARAKNKPVPDRIPCASSAIFTVSSGNGAGPAMQFETESNTFPESARVRGLRLLAS